MTDLNSLPATEIERLAIELGSLLHAPLAMPEHAIETPLVSPLQALLRLVQGPGRHRGA